MSRDFYSELDAILDSAKDGITEIIMDMQDDISSEFKGPSALSAVLVSAEVSDFIEAVSRLKRPQRDKVVEIFGEIHARYNNGQVI